MASVYSAPVAYHIPCQPLTDFVNFTRQSGGVDKFPSARSKPVRLTGLVSVLYSSSIGRSRCCTTTVLASVAPPTTTTTLIMQRAPTRRSRYLY